MTIKTPPPNNNYRDNFDAIFKKKDVPDARKKENNDGELVKAKHPAAKKN